MRVILIDITPNAETLIAECAAICYGADTSPGANERRVKKLMNLKHLATLRFAYATFKVEGVSRVCSHQLVRHPHLSYLQRCVAGDTRIYVSNTRGEDTNRCTGVEIAKLYKQQQSGAPTTRRVKTFDEQSGTFVFAKIKEVFHNGTMPVFEVKADSLSIMCTEDHRFLTPSGFKELKYLRVGDLVARNGEPAYKSMSWMVSAKQRAVRNGTGLAGIADECGVSTATVRKWLAIHGLQFTKKEVAMYTSPWNKGLTGEDIPWFGRKATEDECRLISEAKIGDKNPMWGGGVTATRKQIANRVNSNRLIRERVLARDGGKCRACGSENNLEIDHIVPVALDQTLAYDENNLQVLCTSCHIKKSIEDTRGIKKTVRFVRLTSITDKGPTEVYDLEVDHPSHNYVANKFVTHNSQRYCSEFDNEVVVPPPIIGNPAALDAFEESVSIASHAYQTMIKAGVRKEDARFILPQSTTTEMYVTGNFQAWFDMLKRRLDQHAQWEIRKVAEGIFKCLNDHAPNVFTLENLGVA